MLVFIITSGAIRAFPSSVRSVAQPLIFMRPLFAIAQRIAAGIHAVASSRGNNAPDNGHVRCCSPPTPLPPPPSPLPLPPLRFLNTSEERVLRHCRPRVSLSTMPRRSRKLPLDLGLDLSTRRRCVNSRVEASGGDGYPSHSSLAREPLCTTCCADAICALTLVLILDG
jgi:hypothetical protein